jgi:hypothetical protein
VPSQPLSNRFAALSIVPDNEDTIRVSETGSDTASETDTSTNKSPKGSSPRMMRWECNLPKHFIIAASPSPNSLNLEVEIQMTDTVEVKGVTALLLDSGATGLFINPDFALAEKRSLTRPAPVYNVDGTPNEGGAICKVVDVILRFRGHSERAIFAVTNLGKHKMILGYPWLRNHNPEVNWQTQEVTLSRCPAQCHTCRAKVRKERRGSARIHARRMGPLPQMVEEEEEEEEEPESVDFRPLLDLFATVSTPTVPTKVIAASTTTAQQLAEKALCSVPAKERELIPPYLCDFEDVYAKESFDSLPEQRTWDHAIELEECISWGSEQYTRQIW